MPWDFSDSEDALGSGKTPVKMLTINFNCAIVQKFS